MSKNNRKKGSNSPKNTAISRNIAPVAPATKEAYDFVLCQKLAAQLENKEINQLIIYRNAKTKEIKYLADLGDCFTDYERIFGYIEHFSKFGTTENLAIRIQKTFEGLRHNIEIKCFDMMERMENSETPPYLNDDGGANFTHYDTISEKLINLLMGQGLIEMFLFNDEFMCFRVSELGKFMKKTYGLPY